MFKAKFILGKSQQWINYNYNNFEIWLSSYENTEIKNKIYKIIDNNKNIKNNLENLIKNTNEHFGIIVIYRAWALAAVDPCRSRPIFWTKLNKEILFSNNALKLSNISNSNIDNNQRIAFQMSGYTIGNGTLWKNIKNINSGELIFYNSYNSVNIIKYHLNYSAKITNNSFTSFKKELKNNIYLLIKNLIKKANGNTIVVPLSAGLDSRLIVSGLYEFKYKNVKCFSYGLKNNFESIASQKIAKKLGYKWQFVEINNKISNTFYSSKEFIKFYNEYCDGCSTPGVQDLFAISQLKKINYFDENDIIVNGNSGDFISGGHIPNSAKYWKLSANINNLINKIFDSHFNKHYSLWNELKNNKNKNVIKEEIFNQIKDYRNISTALSPHCMLELIELENRQSKYVINFQRVYDFYNIKWLLPLWNKSFLKFWCKVPLKYKINQKLYKETLIELNMGNVWTHEYNFKQIISPPGIKYFRNFLKIFFILLGKNTWHNFDKKYLSYWYDNICGQSIFPYKKIIKNKNNARHFVSWHTLYAEKKCLKSDWQRN